MSIYDILADYQKQINSLRAQLNDISRVDRAQSSQSSQSFGESGWLEILDGLWSYASATTITVPSGAASIYAVGDQIRYKQGGGYKYASVVDIADTLLTVTGGTDYTVANAAITDAAFSKGGGAGFPDYFNFTPSFTNLTVGAGTNEGKFTINGRLMTIETQWVFGSGAAVSTDAKINFPVTAAMSNYGYFGTVTLSDVSQYLPIVGALWFDGYIKYSRVFGSIAYQWRLESDKPFTWTTGDKIEIRASVVI